MYRLFTECVGIICSSERGMIPRERTRKKYTAKFFDLKDFVFEKVNFGDLSSIFEIS